EIVDTVEVMFLDKARGEAEMPPKPAIHPSQDAFIHAMPAFLPRTGAAGVKWISGNPGNRARGLPYIAGLLILNDPETGFPIAVMDATWITAMRTGAATAVAATHLARSESKTVGIVACGVQGRTNLEALCTRFAIEEARAYDIDPDAARCYAEEMAHQCGMTVTVVRDPREAVAELDMVVTSGPILRDPSPVIEAGWISPGAFACALDFDSYWTPAAVRAADRFVTDDLPQLDYYRSLGFFRHIPAPDGDLAEIVAGGAPGRQSDNEAILCMNLGLALEDVAVGKLIYDRAVGLDIGVELEL
ncbi:MAG: ornithine cyclodeaminase family protein, partial [Gemmatimonadota bacterium]|nr:ornithine cyclodeaminase family protein [Gemmatimonadota bacterium]